MLSLQTSSVASDRAFRDLACQVRVPFPNLSCQAGWVRGRCSQITHRTHCLMFLMSHQFCHSCLSLFFFSFGSHCGDQPACCSQCLADSFDCRDRFIAQGKRVYHLIMTNCAVNWGGDRDGTNARSLSGLELSSLFSQKGAPTRMHFF